MTDSKYIKGEVVKRSGNGQQATVVQVFKCHESDKVHYEYCIKYPSGRVIKMHEDRLFQESQTDNQILAKQIARAVIGEIGKIIKRNPPAYYNLSAIDDLYNCTIKHLENQR